MIDLFPFNGLPVAVLGLGKSGLVAAEALQASGAEVLAWDDDAGHRDAAAGRGVPIVDLRTADLREVPSLILSPGIPHSFPAPHPVVERARAAGVEIIGDIELLARSQRSCAYIGITGTNGKSTTTALIGHIMQLAKRTVAVGGNLGIPVLSLPPLDTLGSYVLEMSSYQLELTFSITFDIAVLLNITPDHLDRHGGMAGYVAAKRRIFHRQTAPRTAIIGVDDQICRDLFQELVAADDQVVIPVSAERAVAGGVYVLDGRLIDHRQEPAVEVMDLRAVATLPGQHNWQNAAAAFAAVTAAGVPAGVASACLRSYPGLPHRQELVATVAGVRFVNDSKATNADATAKALGCYDAIYWIAGGLAKDGGIASLSSYFPRIRHAFLIGKAAGDFARILDGKVPVTLSGRLDAAVTAAGRLAAAEARKDAVVLLSPACASFDQFANFEARGDAFRALVTGAGSPVPAGAAA